MAVGFRKFVSKSGHAAAIMFAFALSTPASAQAAPPACRGQNMLDEMQTADAAGHAGIVAAGKAALNGDALLWRIEKSGVQPSYLFGTVHVSDTRVTTISPAVTKALGEVKAVALEIADMSPAAMQKAQIDPKLMVYSNGSGLDKELSPAEFKVAKSVLAQGGMPDAAIPAMRPWVVSMALALPMCEQRRTASGVAVLDQKLGDIARAQKKPVIGLETLGMQLNMLAAIPNDQQLGMLRASLKFADRREDLMETMVQLYLKRQLGSIWPFNLAMAAKAGVTPSAFASFENDLLNGRNAAMRDASRPHLDKGGLFIGVGAMHLIGPKGLVALLREAGFSVSAVE